MKDLKNKSQRRVGLVIQYQGSSFSGWQRQKDGTTVQGLIEKAIEQLDPIRPVKAVAAGRTDAGVHASGQVVHFDSCGYIPSEKFASALNGRLPKSIRILESVEQSAEWHACHSAIFRRYRYSIYNAKNPNVFVDQWAWHRYQYSLDLDLMNLAGQKLKGFHDFAAFQKSGSDRKSSWTTIQDFQIQRLGDMIYIDIQASGFLYGMVRLLVGQLVAIGEHKLSISAFERRWMECIRCEVKEAAPAKGLCLVSVGYKTPIFSELQYGDTFPKCYLTSRNPPITY